MSVIQQLEQEKLNGTGSSQAIAEFLLEQYPYMGEYTMEAVAEETYTSKSSLVRFAQRLGFSGWRELVFEIEHYVLNNDSTSMTDIDANFPFDKEATTQQLINNISHLEIQTVKGTEVLLNIKDIELSADLIHNAEKVVIFGLSPNQYYAQVFSRQLLSIGKTAFVPTSGEYGLHASALGPKDIAIIISYSGNSIKESPLKEIPILQKNKVPIISLTSLGQNYLRDVSDSVLTIYSRERLYTKISSFSTEISIKFLLNVLFSKIFQLDFDRHLKYKIDKSKELEIKRETLLEEISEE